MTIWSSAEAQPPLSQVLFFLCGDSVPWCWIASVTGPVWRGLRSLSLGLRGSRSNGETHSFFQLQCLFSGEYREAAGDRMDTEARHCGSNWNENSASSRMQLHGTSFGWIHCCALCLGTWLQHKSFNGCLHSLGYAFSTSYDEGSQFPSDFAGGTGRSDAAERRCDGPGCPGVLLASSGWMQWCSTDN